MSRLRLSIVFILLIAISLLTWLVATESGLHWAYKLSLPYLPEEFGMNKLQGRLIGPMTLEGVKFQQDGTQIEAEKITFDWQPVALVAANIAISHIRIQSPNIVLPESEESDQALTMPEIHLPWRTTLNDVQINDLRLKQNDQAILIKQIRLNASSLLSTVNIKNLSIIADAFNLDIKGELQPTHSYHHNLNINWETKLASGTLIKGNSQLVGDLQTSHFKNQLREPLQLALDVEINDLLGHINWQTRIDIDEFDTAQLNGDLPALSGALQLNAKGDLTTATVSGRLHDYPVSVQSHLKWRDDGLDIIQLDIYSADSQISAKGRVDQSLKLDWIITANNLSEFHAQAQGQIHAEGNLTGALDAPTIQATINGQDLSMLDYHVGTLDGKLHVDLFRWQQFDLNLGLQSLNLNGYPWQSLNVNSTGQQIEIKAVSDHLTALVELLGKVDMQGWHGRLDKVELNSQRFHRWQLKQPATLNITDTTIQAQPICLQRKDSEVCIVLQRDEQIWQAKLDAEKIPLMLFAHWLPVDLRHEGLANATAKLQFQMPDLLYGQGNIELQSGKLSYPLIEGELDHWEYQGGTIAFSLNEQAISTSAELTMSNGDQFNFKAELPGAQLLAMDKQQRLHAEAKLSIHDLGLFEALLPEVQDLEGEISLNFYANGSLAQPLFSGNADLLNGALRIPRLGLSITRLGLNSRIDRSETLSFQLDAYSGEGSLSLSGQTILNRADGWPTSITIKGNEFEVSNIPEARALASPDLQIKIKDRTIEIQGDIHVPYAKLQPKDISTAARVTEDAVIVGAEKAPQKNWLLDSRIRLTLGERVHFYGYGFEGRLGGNLLLEDEPGHLTKATGEISIHEGRYRAYGQRLEIEHGRFLFTGGTLTNPGLDLRAVRHVGDITTGLKVRGSVNQPIVELFSSPTMGQTDALAYLMLGAPIEGASGEDGAMMARAALALGLSSGDYLARILGDRFGLDEMRVESSDQGDQASLVVGRYLSPKLYVSYGVGLVETFNTLTLRYKISEKWQLKAESGEYQGADILYTIDR